MRRFGSCFILVTLVAAAGGCQFWQHPQTASAPGRDGSRARDLNDRAFRYIEKGDYEHAQKILRDAVAADPMFGPARNNLGLCYYHTNHLYEAAWEFENAIRLMPYQPEPRNNLGLVLEKAGKLSNAADAYAKARELEPDNPEFLGNLARAKVRRGDRDQETQILLEELVLKDSRPDWNDWARMNLFRIKGLEDAATTQP
jgi:Flp pilus assembly protein TadD